jgi:hypothetical protein
MVTLTDTAKTSREIIKWSFIILVGLMIGRMIIGGLVAWYRAANPVVVPPSVGFGVIPPVAFPDKETPPLTYVLETATGRLPNMPEQADVIYVPSQRPDLLAMERSAKDAASMGYKTAPEKIDDLSYRWRVSTPLTSTLTMQIYDGRFTLKTDWAANPNFLNEVRLPDEKEAVKQALSVARRLSNTAADLGEQTAKVQYLRGLGGAYQPAASLSEADFIQVDLFRLPHQDYYRFVTPEPDQGVVRVIISGNARLGPVVQVDYNYFTFDRNWVETYPLKPVAEAWAQLQNGHGYVARVNKG